MAAAPIPSEGAAHLFTGAGGVRLRAALFPVSGELRGSVVLSPGRTEAIEKYFETVDQLRARGFAVLVHDWRGQGLSSRALTDRRLGHADRHADFMEDFQGLLLAFQDRLPGPCIALGHSMGGCLTLLALAQGERRFSGAILSAPMLGLRLGPIPAPAGRTVAAAAKLFGLAGAPIGRVGAVPDPFEANILTHDRARYERNHALLLAHPDLALGPPTWGWLAFAFSAMDELRKGMGATALNLPIVMVAAGEERLTDNAATRYVAARIPGARHVEIAGAYHEILQETDAIQAAFWREFDALAIGL